jgi:hypothetical protein
MICFPAGLCDCTGPAVVVSGLKGVHVDSEDRFLRASGDCLVDFRVVSLIRYFWEKEDIWLFLETLRSLRLDTPASETKHSRQDIWFGKAESW